MRSRWVVPLLLVLLFTNQAARAGEPSAHDFTFTSIEGAPLPMSTFGDKVVLVVNTASFCGFTHQYAALQALYQRYRNHGLVVLGVPSNDFGSQEPGSEGEIKDFCEVNYGIDFPMTEKLHVKGAQAHPFYTWAAEAAGPEGRPQWNFHKYLIGPDGRLARWFPTATAPASHAVTDAIEAELARIPAAGG